MATFGYLMIPQFFYLFLPKKHDEVPNSEIKLFQTVNVHIMRSFFESVDKSFNNYIHMTDTKNTL